MQQTRMILLALVLLLSACYVMGAPAASELTLDKRLEIIDWQAKENDKYLYDSLLGRFQKMKATAEEVASRDPQSEFSRALLWLNHDYNQFAIKEFALNRGMLDVIKELLISIDKDNNPTKNRRKEDLTEMEKAGIKRIPVLDKEFILNYLAPIVVTKIMSRAYEDLKETTKTNWQRIYHLIDHYTSKRTPKEGSTEGLTEFKDWAREVAQEYKERIVNKMDEFQQELNIYTLELPKKNDLRRSRFLLEKVVNDIINYTVKNDNVQPKVGEQQVELNLPSLTNEEAMSKLLEQYVPAEMMSQFKELGTKLREPTSNDDQVSFSWDWQNPEIFKIDDSALAGILEHVH